MTASRLTLPVALAFLAAGCGSSTSPPPARDTAASGDAGGAAFARCMREAGFDMPHPQFGAAPDPDSEAGRALERQASSSAWQEAERRCGERHPQPAEEQPSPAEVAESDDALLRFARCMRAGGVDVPDPHGGQLLIPSQVMSSPLARRRSELCHRRAHG